MMTDYCLTTQRKGNDMTDAVKTTDIQKYESGLSIEKHNELANNFNPFMRLNS